jgi:hypothetical protein
VLHEHAGRLVEDRQAEGQVLRRDDRPLRRSVTKAKRRRMAMSIGAMLRSAVLIVLRTNSPSGRLKSWVPLTACVEGQHRTPA